MITKNEITTILQTILDPELGYNIVDLGLIYNIDISSDSKLKTSDSTLITITMTLTSPGCPLAPFFIDQIKTTLSNAFQYAENQIEVQITFDPPWSPEAIAPDIKLNLGL